MIKCTLISIELQYVDQKAKKEKNIKYHSYKSTNVSKTVEEYQFSNRMPVTRMYA